MAGNEEPVEPQEEGQRLLQNKLKILQGIGQRRTNLALDILTGRVDPSTVTPRGVDEEFKGASIGNGATRGVARPTVAPVEKSAQESARAKRLSRRNVLARTVYLSEQDLRDIEFIVRQWHRRVHKRVSRSEVLRQAIGNLRDAVELGASPRDTDIRLRQESEER